ncbi:MAG: methylated-DNA--[protein]-cysteine S-methyltransferase [Balneolales bacterium]
MSINMEDQQQINFNRIAEAIDYIQRNFRSQPILEEVAKHTNLSSYHFQRMFTQWAGISPKQFLQYTSIEYAKKVLKENKPSLFEAAMDTGLSGTGRLHDLFLKIEGMTPGEYKNGGENLFLNYSYAETPFGKILVASTAKGICYMAFADSEVHSLKILQNKFPNASYRQMTDHNQQTALNIFTHDWSKPDHIKLHLKGSDFQLKVWETLIKIPTGRLTTYGDIARQIDIPKASRAVGTAIGKNPVAILIPCHRVIRSTGAFGGYHWGSTRKTAMIGWEAVKVLK